VESTAEYVELPNGVKLSYVAHGNSSGIPVLLLHGATDSWHSFELALPRLPESIRAFALSQRGHGDSDRPAADYYPHDFAADAAAFMDVLKIESAVIVGHSMGSYVAQQFAIDFPGRTLGLVLVGSFINCKDNPGVMDLWDSTVSGLTDPIHPDFVRKFQEGTIAQSLPQTFFEMVVQDSLKVPAYVWKAVFEGLLKTDLSGKLCKVTAPTLIIWGDKDAFFPRSDQEILSATIKDSQLVVYPGAGHAVHWEEPDRFASDLVGFINKLAR
jgi:non-heme chloroperoxidase